MKLERTYFCEAAHQLTAGVPEGHPCRRLHGHRYEVTVSIIGAHHELKDGMLMEYADLDAAVSPVLDLVDHRFINELGFEAIYARAPGSLVGQVKLEPLPVVFKANDLADKVRENPTVENLVEWLYHEILERVNQPPKVKGLKTGPVLFGVDIREDPRSVVSR